MRIHLFIPALLAAAILFGHSALAQSVSSTTTTVQSAFVTDGTLNGVGQSNYNFGAAGTMALAGANSGNGTLESVMEFSLSSIEAGFNTEYGVGNWSITGVSLSLASNFAVQGEQPNNAIFPAISGGGFGLAWIPDNSWTAGTGNPGSDTTTGVTYNTLGPVVSGSENVGTYTYTPPGNNIYLTYSLDPTSDLLSDILSGGDLSLVAYPTDNTVSYLFNTVKYGGGSNEPILTVTVSPVPEPATWGSILMGLTGMVLLRRRRRG